MPVSVAIAHHSATGHTARLAAALAKGAASLPGADAALVRVDALGEEGWATLDAADAIVFGAPTHMGAPSAPFAAFAAATQSRWLADRWRDKVAAGFTDSGTIAGDKLHTLQTFAILAAQHGMIWVGLDLKAGWSTSDGSPDELNRLGSWLGAMSHSPLDLGPDLAPRDSDLRTAAHLGRRVARIAYELRRGRAGGVVGAGEAAAGGGAASAGSAGGAGGAGSAGGTGSAGGRGEVTRAAAGAAGGAEA
jgi:NAD(P)H dehydrogenase (quinone)